MYQERNEFEQVLIERAWKDEEFHQALRTNPKQVIAEEYGTTFPDDLELEVFEETANKAYFVIPVNPAAALELNEDELELVAGGADLEACSWMWCSSAEVEA